MNIAKNIILIACQVVFFATSVFAEMNVQDYLQTLKQTIKNNEVKYLNKLVAENPNTTLKVIHLLESKGINDLATVLKSTLNNPNKDEELSRAVALNDDGEKLFATSDFRGAINSWETALIIFQKLGIKEAIGVLINNLGGAYGSLGDHKTAITYFEKSLAIDEEKGNKKGKGASLANLGRQYTSLGDYRKAITYFEKAITIAEEIGDKKGECARLSSLGVVYNDLGDTTKAVSFYEKSLVIAEEIGDQQCKLTNLGNLGSVYLRLGGYREAIHSYEKALAIANENNNKIAIGSIIDNLGVAYLDLRDFKQAIYFHEKALAIAKEIGNKKGEHNSLGNLGNVNFDLGDYNKAIGFQEKALAVAKEIGDKKGMVADLGNMGNAFLYLNNYEEAIRLYEKAVVISKEIKKPYGQLEGNIADAFFAFDRNDEALAIYKKQNHPIRLGRYYLKKLEFTIAKEQFNRDIEKNELGKKIEWILPKYIGQGLSNEGLQDYVEAYTWYKKAISLMEDQRDALSPAEREHYFEGKEFGIPRIEAYEGAFRCAFMLGKYDEAFFWAENTRGRLTSELLSSRHSGSTSKIPADLAKEEEKLTTQITTNKKQQQIAFEKNNPELQKKRESEYPALKKRMDALIDRLRREYPQYAAIKYPQPVKLSQLALKPGETIIEYEVTEPYTIGMVIRDGKVFKAFKIDKTRKELEAMVKRFRAPFQEGADISSFSLNQATELAALLLKPALSAVNKGDKLIIIPDEMLSLVPFESLLFAAPAEALKEEATLLAQATQQPVGDMVDKTSIIRGLARPLTTRSLGVSVSPRVSTRILFDTGSATISKDSSRQMKEIVAALGSNELKGVTIRIEGHTDSVGDPKYNLRLSQKRSKAVYDYLTKNGIAAGRLNFTGKGDTEPVADNKDEKGRSRNRRVDFVRVSAASATSQKAQSSKDFVYAIDQYPMSYYQSASVLSLQRGLNIKRATDKNFFGLGDPIFDSADSRSAGLRGLKVVAKDQPTAPDIANNEETKDAGYSFGRLVNTEKEVKEVGKLFGNAKLLTGADASEEYLKNEKLSDKRYLLFSTHGILGNEIPYIKQPALVLNQVGNDKEDGFLTASEIFGLNLNADVVCLSACKTGLGVQSAGEGVVGLSRAFMYAGTDTVLVSLWSVADESTYKLMVKFFEGLRSGKDKMTSLKEAKNYLRMNGYDNPFYWAPFILIGEAN